MLPPLEIFGITIHWFAFMMVLALLIVSFFGISYQGRDGYTISTLRDRNVFIVILIILLPIGLWSFSWTEHSIIQYLNGTFKEPESFSELVRNIGNRWFGVLFIITLFWTFCFPFFSKIFVLRSIDLTMLAASLGIAIGRIGCTLEGHYGCSGIPTDLPWGIIFPYSTIEMSVPVHPIQIYDSIFYFICFGWMVWADQKKELTFGKIGLLFLLATSVYNIFIWELRNDVEIFFIFAFGQVIYIIILIIALFLWWLNFGKEE